MSRSLEDGYRCAMQKLVLGERESAIRTLQDLVQQAPSSVRYRVALQAALTARQRALLTEMSSASTEELMAEALKLKETHELRASIRFIKRRKWAEAERVLLDALADREEQAEKQILLALVRTRGQQSHRAALAPALRGVALAPRRQDALYLLEEIHLATAQHEQARAVRLRAWEQASGDPSKRKHAMKRLSRFIAPPHITSGEEQIAQTCHSLPMSGAAEVVPRRSALRSLQRLRLALTSSFLVPLLALIGVSLRS